MNHHIPMPPTIKQYNGVSEPCDMADGPCCCGAWHFLGEWSDEVRAAVSDALRASKELE